MLALGDVVALYDDGGVDVETRRAFETPGNVTSGGVGVELVDAAIADGRVPFSTQEPLERLFEQDAETTRAFVEGREPDWRLARENAAAATWEASRRLDAEIEAYRRTLEAGDDQDERERISREYGIPVEEVV